MKRLIKKAFGQTLYHGTTIENLEKITEMGMIVPQESEGAGLGKAHEVNIHNHVYNWMKSQGLDPDDDNLFNKYYEEEYEKDEQLLNGYTFFTNNLEKAMDYSWDGVVIEASLPDESLMPDDNDCSECKTWQESLQATAQVKVLGTITDNYIVGVHMKDEFDDISFYPKFTWATPENN